MLFKKLFHMLVLGGAVVGTNSGCATTTNADGTAKPQQSVSGNPSGGLPGGSSGGGGVRGW
jgi:hypothetical protein